MADQLAMTAPGSPGTTAESHSRLARMAALSYVHHQDFAGMDHMDVNLPMPANQQPGGDRIELWYRRDDGPWTPPGLASPHGNIRIPSILSRSNPLIFPGPYRESIHRSHDVLYRAPSECDTVPAGPIPSDSGYGSYGTKHSVANESVCEEPLDRSPETQSLLGHLGDLSFPSFNHEMMPKGAVNPGTPWMQPHQPSPLSMPVIDRQRNLEASKTCGICHKVMRTKSELKKHKQRHEKPFKCNVKDCTRREGFSTSNDLDRHIRSLHPTENATGSRFQCLIGACKNKDKIWPRADNFRAHMKRVHQKELSSDDDLDMYKFSPTASSKEPSDLSQHAIGPEFNSHVFPTDFMAGGSIIPRDSTLELSNEATPMESSSQFQMEDTEDQIAPSSEGPTRELTGIANEVHSDNDYASFDQEIDEARPSSGPSSPTINDTESRIPKGLEEPNPTTHPGDADPISSNTIETPRDFKADELDEPQERPSEQLSEGPLYSSHSEAPGAIQEGTHTLPESENSKEASDVLISREKLSKLLENLQNNIVLGELLGELGWKKDESSESQVPKQETTRNATPEPTHVCSECQKRFGRRCELKKHEKRHLKPYGCTYPGCDKRFGSKNDWKRHENSQHYMLEHWRCDEKQTDSSNICGKTIHRRELFKQHLGAFHNIKDPAILDIKLETCRVGRNCEARFWCGFCEEVIEIRKQGMEAWTERFNHIDDHFHGRNNQTQREIGDWKNEYPLYPRGDSSVDDSEDSGATSSTLASSATLPSIHSHPNKQVTRDARKKRKRDDGYDTPALKRPEMAEDLPRSFCCRCSEPMPFTSRQCTNYPCDHRLCENCHSP